MSARLVKKPMYQQLNTILRDMIVSGECGPHTKFLTEREVADRFDVSRTTANKALSSLVSEGLLEFRKGVGTFVCPGILNVDLSTLVSFTEKAKILGKNPSTEVTVFEKTSFTDLLADAHQEFSLEPDDEVIYTERVRAADSIPVIFEKRYLISSLLPGLKKEDLNGSLYCLITEKYSREITGAEQTITAVSADDETALLLNTEPGAPLLHVQGKGYTGDRELLWYERTLYRGDMYEFANTVGPAARGGPAVGRLV